MFSEPKEVFPLHPKSSITNLRRKHKIFQEMFSELCAPVFFLCKLPSMSICHLVVNISWNCGTSSLMQNWGSVRVTIFELINYVQFFPVFEKRLAANQKFKVFRHFSNKLSWRRDMFEEIQKGFFETFLFKGRDLCSKLE